MVNQKTYEVLDKLTDVIAHAVKELDMSYQEVTHLIIKCCQIPYDSVVSLRKK